MSEALTAAKLEAAILENPDDDAPYLVYADWLMAQADPRGELIVLQHDADEASGARKSALRRAANALLEQHEARFLGTLARRDDAELAVVWRYGFVRKLALQWSDTFDRDGALALLEEVLVHPSFQFAIELQIGCLYDDHGELDVQAVIDTLAALRRPAAARLLDLGITPRSHVTTELAELGELISALPRLRRIRLRERRWDQPRPDDVVHEISVYRSRKRYPAPP